MKTIARPPSPRSRGLVGRFPSIVTPSPALPRPLMHVRSRGREPSAGSASQSIASPSVKKPCPGESATRRVARPHIMRPRDRGHLRASGARTRRLSVFQPGPWPPRARATPSPSKIRHPAVNRLFFAAGGQHYRQVADSPGRRCVRPHPRPRPHLRPRPHWPGAPCWPGLPRSGGRGSMMAEARCDSLPAFAGNEIKTTTVCIIARVSPRA